MLPSDRKLKQKLNRMSVLAGGSALANYSGLLEKPKEGVLFFAKALKEKMDEREPLPGRINLLEELRKVFAEKAPEFIPEIIKEGSELIDSMEKVADYIGMDVEFLAEVLDYIKR